MTEPIQIKDKAAPIVVSESFKIAVAAGLAVIVDRTMHSETAIIAVLAASGVVATWLWGLRLRLKNWKVLKFLADKVPDSVAIVGKPQ